MPSASIQEEKEGEEGVTHFPALELMAFGIVGLISPQWFFWSIVMTGVFGFFFGSGA